MYRTRITHTPPLAVLFELGLVLAVCAGLWHLAQPITVQACGLAQRYCSETRLPDVPFQLSVGWSLEPLVARAYRLNRWANGLIGVMVAASWLAVWLGRRQRPGNRLLILALWLLVAMSINPWGVAGLVWALACSGCVTLYLLFYSWRRLTTPAPQMLGWYFVWGMPGWVLFSGLGILLNLDLSARGPVDNRFLAVHQVDAWWLAGITLCLCVACRDQLIAGLARLGIASSRLAGWRLLMFYLLIALVLGWIGRPLRDHGLGKSYLSGDLIRIVFGVASTWLIYRAAELRGSAALQRTLFTRLSLLGLATAFSLAFVAEDNGPLMILSLAGLFVLLPIGLHRYTQHRSGLVAILSFLGLIFWSYLVFHVLPNVSQRAAERVANLDDPAHASSPYLIQIQWLTHASENGFGLGRVPWCGAHAQLGLHACSNASGIPKQFASDYTFAGLMATFGSSGALAIALCAALWLYSLHKPLRGNANQPLRLLQQHFILCFSLLTIAQGMIATGGSLGLLPLTGVTLPLISNGGISLILNALWLGIALNPSQATTGVRS